LVLDAKQSTAQEGAKAIDETQGFGFGERDKDGTASG
jgi:hypothetical protein